MSTYSEKHKRYYEAHKEEINARRKEYVKKHNRDYYLRNRDKIREQTKINGKKARELDKQEAFSRAIAAIIRKEQS